MKIYKPLPPPQLLRINIKKQGVKSQHIVICECEQSQFYDYVKSLIESQKLSVFQRGKLTNVEIRRATGSRNGKSISLSFKGLEPKQVYEIIINDLKTKK